MRSVHDWFDSYGKAHQSLINRLLHWICVPALLWSVIAALWVIPIPPSLGRPGFWSGMAMVGAFAFYWRLSRPLGLAMLFVFIAFGLLVEALFRSMPVMDLLQLAGVVLVLAWSSLLGGHWIEGSRPAFLSHPAHLLIAPAWLVSRLLQRMKIHD